MFSHSKLAGLLLACVAMLLSLSPAFATNGDDTLLAPYAFTISRIYNAQPGHTISVPVVKTSGTGEIHGFDFLMSFDTTALTFTGAEQGYIFGDTGSLEWEYFVYRSDTLGTPPGRIRAVGVADLFEGDHHPISTIVPDGETLFTLFFTVTSDTAFNCSWNPIQFYWVDCGDNTIVPDSTGSVLGTSNAVYDWNEYVYYDIADPDYGFPGAYGAPESCLLDTAIVRLCDFYNGGIRLYCTNDTLYTRGDINCNGIAYEIADWVMNTNYFLYGSAAFDSHWECSYLASDVNADGLLLRLEDNIYLYRILRGDVMPYDTLFPHNQVNVTFIQDLDAKTVSLQYPNNLAAISLLFTGEITPNILVSGDGIISAYESDSGQTRILIAPDLNANNPYFTADGILLTYTGDGILMDAQAADYNDNTFDVSISRHTGGGEITPFAFEIGQIPDAQPGQTLSIPVVKTGGTESISGFDFLISYDETQLSITRATADSLFYIPGGYEWEYFSYRTDFSDSGDTIYSPGMIRVVALANTNDGPHYPLETYVPDGTVLFYLDCEVVADSPVHDVFAPISFYWFDCANNAVAYSAAGDSLALSDHVYSYTGAEITDHYYGFPGYFGAHDLCFLNGPNIPVRFIDFYSGGVGITGSGSITPSLILSIDTVTASTGTNNIYMDVYLSNLQDTLGAFVLLLQMSNPDMGEFGASPTDTNAILTTGTLIENWASTANVSMSGTYHDIKILALADVPGNVTNDYIYPQEGGLLVRLLLHTYDGQPDTLMADTLVEIMINNSPTQTGFSTPDGRTIGLTGGVYDPQEVSFVNGYLIVTSYTSGDANNDGYVNIGDAVTILNYVFRGGPAPEPLCRGDFNCDNECNVGDPVKLINYIFRSGPPPCAGCGQ